MKSKIYAIILIILGISYAGISYFLLKSVSNFFVSVFSSAVIFMMSVVLISFGLAILMAKGR